jgi:signal transduction histidine kinase
MERYETDLIELQRRAALGTMCAGLAHEVHAPLGCAATLLRQALQRVQAAPTHHALDAVLTGDLGRALECVILARTVLRDAMELAAPASSAGTTDLSRAADSVLSLGMAVKPAHVVVLPRLEPGLRVLGTRTHVQQIVLNLLMNAFRALEDRDTGEESLVRVTTGVVSAATSRLVVEDNGPGIPAALRARLFQPFATSGSAGVGAGLGLHVVKRITDMLGGSIGVDSPRGGGTRVMVELPATA